MDITCQIILCQKSNIRKHLSPKCQRIIANLRHDNTGYTRNNEKEETYSSGSFLLVNLS